MAGLQPERVKAATAWRFTYLAIQGGSSTVIFVWLAQALTPAEFAAAAVAQGVLVSAQAVGDFGLSQAAVSALPAWIAQAPGRGDEFVAGAARAFLVATLAALALALLAALVVPEPAGWAVALIAPAAAAMVVVAGADGLLRARGEFGRPVRLLIVSRIGAFATVPVAIATDSAEAACAALSAGSVLGSLPAAVAVVRRALGSAAVGARRAARAALPLGISQILIVAGGRLNTVVASGLTTVVVGAAFEGAWRLYQLGLYVAGGFATAVAPFLGDALGAGRRRELTRPLLRAVGVAAALGGLWMVTLLVAGDQLSELAFGQALGGKVAGAIAPLAIVTPLSFVGFMAMMALAASDRDRDLVLVANALGAGVNIALVFILVSGEGARGASIAAAAGIGVASLVMFGAFLRLLMRSDGQDVPRRGRRYAAPRRGAA